MLTGRNARSSPVTAATGGRVLLRLLRAARTACLWIAGQLRLSPSGLVVAALIVGAGAGLGAVAFRWLIIR